MDNDWKFVFLSLKGRIARSTWWFGVIGLTITAIVMLVLLAFLGDLLEVSHGVVGLVLFLLMLATFLAWIMGLLALCVKRLQDRGKSGWWLAALYGISFIGVTAMQLGLTQAGGHLTVIGEALLFGTIGMTLWFFVYLGFLKGTTGENRFGPDPLERMANDSD